MRRLILISLLLFTLSVYAAGETDFSRMAGKYVGEVYNGNDMDPVVTTFVVLPDGRLRGNYTAEDEMEIVDGTISNAVLVEGRTYSFEWTDKYGEGKAVLVFTEDFSRFNGYWTNYTDSTQFEWTGAKQ
jgi:hypothetical protein